MNKITLFKIAGLGLNTLWQNTDAPFLCYHFARMLNKDLPNTPSSRNETYIAQFAKAAPKKRGWKKVQLCRNYYGTFRVSISGETVSPVGLYFNLKKFLRENKLNNNVPFWVKLTKV
jgi:hypothetical protein